MAHYQRRSMILRAICVVIVLIAVVLPTYECKSIKRAKRQAYYWEYPRNDNAYRGYVPRYSPFYKEFDYADDPEEPEKENEPENTFEIFKNLCGQMPMIKIVGGEEAKNDTWHWMASLMYLNPRTNKTEHYCGATLITDRHLLTAAHCVMGKKAEDFIVRLGEYDFNDETNQVRQDISVTKIISHELYNASLETNDIALLQLAKKLELNKVLLPICLPDDESFAGKNATVVGWGRTTLGGPISPILQKVDIPVWSQNECKKSVALKVYDVFLCAGYKTEGGHDACQGDSGGPLMVQNSEQQWSIVGIVSWGIKCAQKGVPGFYTRVTEFKDWIQTNAA